MIPLQRIKGRNETGMKRRLMILLISLILLIVPEICRSETTDRDGARPAEWKWNPGSVNTFTGEIDLSAFSGQKLNIQLLSDLPVEQNSENESNPVFLIINGKRIPVLKQGDTAVFTPGEGNTSFSYTGQIILPGKHRVRAVLFTLRITDENNQAIRTIHSSVTYQDTASGRSDGSFYIPYDIEKLTVILCLAASVVWTAVFCICILNRRKNRNEV